MISLSRSFCLGALFLGSIVFHLAIRETKIE